MRTKRLSSVGCVVTLVLGGLLYAVITRAVLPTWWYATGTATHATVDGCRHESHRNLLRLTCTGHWTSPGGEPRQGRVFGAGSDSRGKVLAVHASGDHAVALNTEFLMGDPLDLAILIGIGGFLGYRVLTRRQARRKTRPTPHQDTA
ncbi:hypothetical protein AB0L06_12985 [Spirillospora sp. NPDC052269]